MDIITISLGLLLGCIIGLSWFAGSDAPFVPTKKERIKKLLELLSLKGKAFYELGSGDGRIVIEAAKMGAKAVGIEQSFLRVFYSKIKSASVKNAHFIRRRTSFIHGNIFNLDYSNADVVFIFLLPKGVEKLEEKLKKELKKGSLVVTQTFHFKNWKPYKKFLATDKQTPNTLLGPNKYEGEFWVYKQSFSTSKQSLR